MDSQFRLRYLQGVTSYIAPSKGQSRFQSPGKSCLWNPESCVLESTIQLKECGIPITIGIQNPSSTEKYWNPVPESEIHSVESRIQDFPGFLFMGRCYIMMPGPACSKQG